MRFLVHAAALSAIVFSLGGCPINIIHAANVPLPPPKQCITPEALDAKMGDMKPNWVLRGEALHAFNENFRLMTGSTALDNDLLVVYKDPDPQLERVLMVSFRKGCIIRVIVAPQEAFEHILNGPQKGV